MNLLNENSLASLLTNCYQNRRYRACILFNTHEEACALFNELIEIHNRDGIYGVDRFIRNRPPQIRFENGSILTLISISQTGQIRGRRHHEALLHEDVMDTDAMIALQSQIYEYIDDSGTIFDRIDNVILHHTNAVPDATNFNTEFETIYKGTTIKPTNRSGEVKVDDTSKEILDDFLDSFKINNSLEFGA